MDYQDILHVLGGPFLVDIRTFHLFSLPLGFGLPEVSNFQLLKFATAFAYFYIVAAPSTIIADPSQQVNNLIWENQALI